MKAITFEGAGDANVLRLVDEPMPEIRPNDLLVHVRAAGINRADILQRQGFYGVRPDFGDSLVPGLEIAGEVVEVGPKAEGYKIGDRVMAIVGGGGYPFGLVRRNARQTAQVNGIELHGPHIEKVVVEVGGDLPDDLGFTDAAWSPDMQGHALANERMKRFIELGGFHGLSL